MIESGIFLKVGDELELLRPEKYDSEEVLQAALADYPQVIAGQTTDGETKPLALVTREIGIPGTAFSLDHLFLDSHGIPVLVEVKRASDTRIRRAVVGQMLDYAANAAANWPVSFLREKLEEQVAASKKDPEEYMAGVVGELDVEDYWERVDANLTAGRLRMIFVADELPGSLVRIIEFCNEQMSPAEVLGVEVRLYTAGGHVAYVPHVVGATSTAVTTKQTGKHPRWTRETFTAAAESQCAPAVLTVALALLDHVDKHGTKLAWGAGQAPGVGGWYDLNSRPTGSWALILGDGTDSYPPTLAVSLGDIVKYVSPSHVEAFVKPLEAVPSMRAKLADARANGWSKWPVFQLEEFADHPDQVAALLEALTVLASPDPG